MKYHDNDVPSVMKVVVVNIVNIFVISQMV